MRKRLTLGFLINPIAGMGGSVGLKGTDNLAPEAIRRGATPKAPERAEETLLALKGYDIHFLTCAGAMGETSLLRVGNLSFEVIYTPDEMFTSAEDTKAASGILLARGVDAIVFCGGDGTARDVFDAVGTAVPILGIPAGVKMYSAVFAITPHAAAEIIRQLPDVPLTDAEVMDVDEQAYRNNELSTRLYGYARTPIVETMRQTSKWVSHARSEESAQKEIAIFISEIMRDDTLYLVGAGTTTREIARILGVDKTLLGVDAMYGGNIIARDLNEHGILPLLDQFPRVKIIISPIGSQGFILGRGNQQISAEVLRRVGIENLIIVATPQKLAMTPVLYVDSGDHSLDREFGESIAVVSGYRMAQRKKIIHS